MTTKRIRCSCGRVYDPVKRPACPDCGTVNPVVATPESLLPNEPETTRKSAADSMTSLPSPSLSVAKPARYFVIGAAVLCVLALLIFFARKPGPEKSAAEKHPSPQPSATASLAVATPAPSATSGATAIVQHDIPTPAPSAPSIAQGGDLAALIAQAAPGATVKVPPGTYPSLVVRRPLHLVGDPNMQVFLKGEGQSALAVQSTGVSLQNIQIFCHGIGNLPAVSIGADAELEMNACVIQSGTEIGLFATGKASVKAVGTTFAVPYGAGLRLTEQAKASLTQCSISDTRIGLNAMSGANVDLRSCAFERDGGNEGRGSVLALNGKGTTVTADDCRFLSNSAGLIVARQASLAITKSRFKDNAAGVEGGVAGLIAVRDGAHATFTGVSFESNRQGVAALDGGAIELMQCNFTGNGLWQERQVIPTSLPILVSGENSIAVIRKTIFTNSAQHAIGVMAGGKLTLEDVDISGARNAAVILGERNMAPVRAEIRRSHLNANGTGLGLLAGSSAEIEDTELRENNDGIIAFDADTQLKATKTSIIANRDRGLYVYLHAVAHMVDCDLKNNGRGAISGTHGRPGERASITLENCRFGGNKVYGAGASMQSELILTNCVFDGTDKTNTVKERGAKIQKDETPTPAPTVTPSGEAETSPTPEESVEPSASPSTSPEESPSPSPEREKSTPRPRRKPTPRPHPPTPEDIRRALRRLLPGGP